MIDNYFSTGNVYVIDDQVNEATPIINSLYSHQVPHIYLDGGTKGLPAGNGTVFKMFPDGTLTTLKSFSNNVISWYLSIYFISILKVLK